MNDLSRLLEAASFAAQRHRDQRRKDVEKSPYINHPLSVAQLLSIEGKVTDVEVLMAALLHDTIEDTETTVQELRTLFGNRVTDIVLEVTDDKSLPKARRKELQIEHAAHKTAEAALVKIADKTCNLRDVAASPPSDWSIKRGREYFDWALRVVEGLPEVEPRLREAFAAAYALKPPLTGEGVTTNCTRVVATLRGVLTEATFKDHETQRMEAFAAHHRATGAIVTLERSVWIE